MAIESFLNKLQKVKRRGHGQWMACCPVHQEKTPSLSIKDDNGTVIMHCFGCGAGGVEVTGALSLDPSELFPPRDNYNPATDSKKRSYFPADQVLEALQTEATVLLILTKDILDNGISEEVRNRLLLSVERLHAATYYTRP